MLDHQLKNAKQTQKTQIRLVAIIALVLMLVITASIAVINWSSSSPDLKALTGDAIEEHAQEVMTPASEVENNQARQQFKASLKQFEQQVSPHLSNKAISQWSPQRHAELMQGKNEALSDFARGDYKQATQALVKLSKQSNALVNEWKQAFATEFSAAKQFFSQDKVNHAQLSLNRALIIKPADFDAQALQIRVSALPDIKHLLDKLAVAEVENNLEQQAKILHQVLNLDAHRQGLKVQLQKIEQTLSERRFNEKIDLGLQRLAEADVSAAKQALHQAQAIYANRSESELLKNKIIQAQNDIALKNALSRLDKLIVADNWPQVLTLTQKWLAKFNDDPKLQKNLALATQLLALGRQSDDYLTRSDRLSDANVRSQAQSFVKNNQLTGQNSLSLTLKMLELESLLTELATPVDVVLRSDGNTHIIVIGEGQIGKTNGRTVALSPGKYVFEGSRQGYRSTRVTVEIAPKIINQEVVVICHERI